MTHVLQPPILLCSVVFFFFSASSGLLRTAGNGEEEILPHCNLQVFTYTCDVGKRENVYLTAERVRKEVGEVSVLVNNAGVVSGHHLLECPDELIERTMMVNCHAHFWVNINILVFNTGPSLARRLGKSETSVPAWKPPAHFHHKLPSNLLFPPGELQCMLLTIKSLFSFFLSPRPNPVFLERVEEWTFWTSLKDCHKNNKREHKTLGLFILLSVEFVKHWLFLWISKVRV